MKTFNTAIQRRMALRVLLFLLWMSGALHFPSATSAQSPAEKAKPAKADHSVGILSPPSDLVVLRNGRKVQSSPGRITLERGDVLRVQGGKPLDLEIGPDGLARLKPGSTLEVINAPGAAGKGESEVVLRLRVGTILVHLKQYRKLSRFVIETPSATTAARGTSYLVRAAPAQTELIVVQGVVELARRGAVVQRVSAAQKVRVRGNATTVVTDEPLEDVDREEMLEVTRLETARDTGRLIEESFGQPSLRLFREDPRRLYLRSDPDKKAFEVKERVSFSISVGEAGYLIVVARGASGALSLLWPDREGLGVLGRPATDTKGSPLKGAKAAVGTRIQIPGADTTFSFTSAGEERVFALLFVAVDDANQFIGMLRNQLGNQGKQPPSPLFKLAPKGEVFASGLVLEVGAGDD